MRFERSVLSIISAAGLLIGAVSQAQMIDNTQAPNTAKAGINKSLLDEIGAGRGDLMTADRRSTSSTVTRFVRFGAGGSCFSASSLVSGAGR